MGSNDGRIPYEFDLTRPVPPGIPPLILSVDPLVIYDEATHGSQTGAPWDDFLDESPAAAPTVEPAPDGRKSALVTIVETREVSKPKNDEKRVSQAEPRKKPLSQKSRARPPPKMVIRHEDPIEMGTDEDDDVICIDLPDTQVRTQEAPSQQPAHAGRKRPAMSTNDEMLAAIMNDPTFEFD